MATPGTGNARAFVCALAATAVLALGCGGDDGGEDDEGSVAASALDTESLGATLTIDDADGRSSEVDVTAEPVGRSVHVGRVDDDLLIAVARPPDADDEILVYLCDGDELSAWIRDTIGPDGGSVSAEGSGGTVEIDLSFAGGGALGEVRLPDGPTASFRAEPAIDGGLFRADVAVEDQSATAAWIVLDDGEQRGLGWWSLEEEEELQM